MRYLLLFFVFCSLASHGGERISVSNLRCESMINPVGVSENSPHFSWWISSSLRDIRQLSYQILVADSLENLNNDQGNIWDSRVCTSDQMSQVTYAGKKLESEKKYFWKVRVKDRSGHASEWSEITWFRTGLLTLNDWGEAKWIALENLVDGWWKRRNGGVWKGEETR